MAIRDNDGRTALHAAAEHSIFNTVILEQLLHAGADPTIRNHNDRTPLDVARHRRREHCIPQLEAAMAKPQRPRTLLEARALVDARALHRIVTHKFTRKGLPPELQRHILALAAPPNLTNRVECEAPLPRVTVDGGQDAQLVACVEYALCEMGKGAFVELCEMITPKWARKDM